MLAHAAPRNRILLDKYAASGGVAGFRYCRYQGEIFLFFFKQTDLKLGKKKKSKFCHFELIADMS